MDLVKSNQNFCNNTKPEPSLLDELEPSLLDDLSFQDKIFCKSQNQSFVEFENGGRRRERRKEEKNMSPRREDK